MARAHVEVHARRTSWASRPGARCGASSRSATSWAGSGGRSGRSRSIPGRRPPEQAADTLAATLLSAVNALAGVGCFEPRVRPAGRAGRADRPHVHRRSACWPPGRSPAWRAGLVTRSTAPGWTALLELLESDRVRRPGRPHAVGSGPVRGGGVMAGSTCAAIASRGPPPASAVHRRGPVGLRCGRFDAGRRGAHPDPRCEIGTAIQVSVDDPTPHPPPVRVARVRQPVHGEAGAAGRRRGRAPLGVPHADGARAGRGRRRDRPGGRRPSADGRSTDDRHRC